ncbi:DoxX family protein [Amycolatopsis sp. NPDC051903]|uniref:DoxX family protein n=1 Tax=Amycolatopsis sp. NPDC051903 TaxID=3363936 RepID=UPI0037B26909
MTSQGDDYQTSLLSGVDDSGGDDDEVRQGGLGLGLLILRVGLAAIVGAHGLQHLFGAFHGPGIAGFAHVLETFGYHKQTTLLSWITGIVEVGGSALLLVGLFTPLAAAGILGVAANAVYAKFHGGFFVGDGRGWEFELLIGVVALALIFTGAGRISLEKNTPWRRRPLPLGIVSLLLAAAASVVVIVLAR